MSSDDVKRYEQISGGKPLPALPEVVQQVGISRKKATLELSFVPHWSIVKASTRSWSASS